MLKLLSKMAEKAAKNKKAIFIDSLLKINL